MIKPIITNQTEDNQILYTKCAECFNHDTVHFIPEDEFVAEIITDLLDTAESVRKHCLGLSANQIGYNRRAFVFRTQDDGPFVPVINPVLIRTSGGIKALEERCLSRLDKDGCYLPGIRMRRPKVIGVEFYDILAKERIRLELKGLRARVFLHELDHLNGKAV